MQYNVSLWSTQKIFQIHRTCSQHLGKRRCTNRTKRHKKNWKKAWLTQLCHWQKKAITKKKICNIKKESHLGSEKNTSLVS